MYRRTRKNRQTARRSKRDCESPRKDARIGEKFQWVRRHSSRERKSVCVFGFQVEHDWHSMGELRLMQLILLQMQRHRTIATQRTTTMAKWQWVRAQLRTHTVRHSRDSRKIFRIQQLFQWRAGESNCTKFPLDSRWGERRNKERTNARASKRVYCDNVQIMEWGFPPAGRQARVCKHYQISANISTIAGQRGKGGS